MAPEEASRAMRERLHRRNPHRTRPVVAHPHRRTAERVTRRVVVPLEHGATEVIPHSDDTVLVVCAAGSVWITHDGDCKDVILTSRQGYRVDREDTTMRIFAMQSSVLEIQFEDDAD